MGNTRHDVGLSKCLSYLAVACSETNINAVHDECVSRVIYFKDKGIMASQNKYKHNSSFYFLPWREKIRYLT